MVRVFLLDLPYHLESHECCGSSVPTMGVCGGLVCVHEYVCACVTVKTVIPG